MNKSKTRKQNRRERTVIRSYLVRNSIEYRRFTDTGKSALVDEYQQKFPLFVRDLVRERYER